MMKSTEMLEFVAERLGDLRDQVVFLGGAVTPLLVTDPGAAPARFTVDVDVIVDVASQLDYHRLSETLRSRGFREDTSEDAPICRWVVESVKVDVMPTSSKVLGFGNKWYGPALHHAEVHQIGDLEVHIVSAPYFLATKLEAFDSRGDGDVRSSHDMEDFIAVVDGRDNIVIDIKNSPYQVQNFLADRVGKLIGSSRFINALPGHLPGDPASQARLPIVVARLTEIARRDQSKNSLKEA